MMNEKERQEAVREEKKKRQNVSAAPFEQPAAGYRLPSGPFYRERNYRKGFLCYADYRGISYSPCGCICAEP